MTKAVRSHYLVVRVRFDKPVHKKDAARLAETVLVNDYYPYGGIGGPEQMDVKSVRPRVKSRKV